MKKGGYFLKRLLLSTLAFLLVMTLPFTTYAQTHEFKDIPKTHRFYNDIQLLVSLDIIDKTPTFDVQRAVTRGEVAEMMVRARGLDGKQRTTHFSDVPPNHAKSGYIQTAAEEGILSGFPDGTFRPNEIVTRGQMALFLVNTFKLTETKDIQFKDVGKNMKAYEAIKKIVAAEITSGFEDKTFRPDTKLQRGQVASFTARALSYELSIPLELRGQYGVNVDLPAGEYLLFAPKDKETKIEVEDASRDLLYTVTIPAGMNRFVELEDGQFFATTDVQAVLAHWNMFDKSSGAFANGEFRVGIDIPEGKYLLLPLGKQYHGYYQITDSSNPFKAKVKKEGDIFEAAIVDVKNGDYLYVSHAGALLPKEKK